MTTENYFPGYIPGILREIEVRDSLSRLPRVPVLSFDVDTLATLLEEIPLIENESIAVLEAFKKEKQEKEEELQDEILMDMMSTEDELKELNLKLGDLTDVEREIILKGCLINYYRG